MDFFSRSTIVHLLSEYSGIDCRFLNIDEEET